MTVVNPNNNDGTSATTFAVGLDENLVLRNDDAWVVDGSEGTGGQVLTSNGTGTSPTWTSLSVTGLANPTASVGLSAIDGSASTAMRSDAAPALSVSISPTWSGAHTFSNPVTGASFVPTGFSIPANGMYLPTANTIGLSANSTQILQSTSSLMYIGGNTPPPAINSANKVIFEGFGTGSNGIAVLGNGGTARVSLLKFNGSISSPTTAATGAGQVISNLVTGGYNGSSVTEVNTLRTVSTEAWSSTNLGHRIDLLWGVTGGTTLQSLVLQDNRVTGPAFIPASASIPPNGLYLPAANTIGFSTDSSIRLSIDSAGTWLLGGSTAGTSGQALISNGAGAAPTWQTVAGGVTGLDNPTASIGLSVINGTATTAMRSDSAPALSQNITPTWTGTHIFNGDSTASTATAGISIGKATTHASQVLVDTSASSNAKLWQWVTSSTSLTLRAVDDAFSATKDSLSIARSGVSVSSLAFGNSADNPTYTFLGTGTTTLNGQVNALRFVPTSSTVPTNGLYLPGANSVGLATNTTARLSIDSGGAWLLGGIAAGTAGQVFTSNGPGTAPTWQTISSGGTAVANPTATIGLSSVNGSASTALRSDGAPALSQSIAPTWTGTHIFNGDSTTSTATAGTSIGKSTTHSSQVLVDTSAGSNGKLWQWITSSNSLTLRTADDAFSTTKNSLSVIRSGASVASLSFGNASDNPTYTFLGTSATTFNGITKAPQFEPTGSAVPSNGLNLPAANTIGFVTGASVRLSINGSGALLLGGSAAGTSGQVLTSSGSGAAPTWQTPFSGSSGTYTPTLTNLENVTSSTANTLQYLRVGNVVTVSGTVGIDPTSDSHVTRLGISLPIASSFASVNQLGGVGSCTSQDSVGAIYADTNNERAEFRFLSPGTSTNTGYAIHFTYLVV